MSDRSPWSLVWPIATGVVLGNAITAILAIGASLFVGSAIMAALQDRQDMTVTTPGHLPARPDAITQVKPTLPTINSALGDGSSQACHNDFVVEYHAREWIQLAPQQACYTIPD